MKSADIRQAVVDHLRRGGRLFLFLDYDGTLVPIAPTPPEAIPDEALLALLRELTERDSIRTAILSGRPLRELQSMLPIPRLIFAGLYGVEMQIGERTILRGGPVD